MNPVSQLWKWAQEIVGWCGIGRRLGCFCSGIFDLGKADLPLLEKKEPAWMSWHWQSRVSGRCAETQPVQSKFIVVF